MKPMKRITTPTESVTENACSSPSRPANEPLADKTNVPSATKALLNTSRFVDTIGR